MIPASNIGKHNYNTLGNQLVGETHASRMKRVNAAQTQPMGLAIAPDPNAALDAAFYGVGGGFIGALAFEKVAPKLPGWLGGGNVSKKTRKTGAVLGSVAGAGLSLVANEKNNNRTEGFGTDPVIEEGFWRTFTPGMIAILGGVAYVLGGLDWEGMKRIDAFKGDNAPGIIIGGGALTLAGMLFFGASPNTVTAVGVGGLAALGGTALAHGLKDAVEG